jgi:hypothetical protein
MMKKLLLLLTCSVLPSAGWAYDADTSQSADWSTLWQEKDRDDRGPRGHRGHRGHHGHHGHHGERGERGHEGIPGVAGLTGPTGPAFSSSFIDVFVSGAAVTPVANGSNVPFTDSLDTVTFGGPFVINGNGSITFEDPGYYLITYGVCVAPGASGPAASPLFGIVETPLSGPSEFVPGSFLSAATAFGTLSEVSQSIITTVDFGTEIALQNVSGATVDLLAVTNGDAQSGDGAYFVAIKLHD